MSGMMKKMVGVVLLLSTTGLASCQAMWAKALFVPFGFWN